MEKSLKAKSVKGIKWTSINTAYNSLVTPLFHMLLAFLLTPNEYAYIAVITLFYRISPIIMKFGVEEAYIQKNNVTNKQVSSLFFFTVCLSVFVSLILLLFSPLIEKLYSLEKLSLIVNLLLVATLIEGSESIFKASLKKYFYFKQLSIILIAKMSIRIISTISLILLGYGVMSFVFGIILGSLLSFLLCFFISFIKNSIRVELYFNLKEIQNFLKFGYPIAGKKLLEQLSQKLDEIVIGTVMSSGVLGVYFFGKNLIIQLKTAIIKSFSTVLLPLYSQTKDSNQELTKMYFTITKYTAIVGFPALFGIALTADIFVPVIFGEKWMDSVFVIQILSIAIILPIITENNATSLLYSLNKPLLVLKIEITTNIAYFISLAFTTELKGILICFSSYLIVNAMGFQYFVNKALKSNLVFFIKNFKEVLIAVVVMTVFVITVKNANILNWGEIPTLILSILTGIITYMLTLLVIDRKSVTKLLKLVLRTSKS